jgi:hypothetical protein
MVVVPTLTSTVVSAWTDRALDAQRLNLRENRPEVAESAALLADYYRQHGVGAAESLQMAGAVEGGFAKVEAAAQGVQFGLRFLSVVVGGVGLLVTIALACSGAARRA